MQNLNWRGQFFRSFLQWKEEENRKKNCSCFRANLLVSVLLLIAASQKPAHWQFYTQPDKSGVWSGGSWTVETGWRGEKKGRRVGGQERERRKSRVWGWTSQTELSILFALSEALQTAVETQWASASTVLCKSLQRPLGTLRVIWLLVRREDIVINTVQQCQSFWLIMYKISTVWKANQHSLKLFLLVKEFCRNRRLIVQCVCPVVLPFVLALCQMDLEDKSKRLSNVPWGAPWCCVRDLLILGSTGWLEDFSWERKPFHLVKTNLTIKKIFTI